MPNTRTDEEKEISLLVLESNHPSVIPYERFSTFDHLKRVTCWITRFALNCRRKREHWVLSCLTTLELQRAENYWYKVIQLTDCKTEVENLSDHRTWSDSSPRIPFLDDHQLLRVGGRRQLSQSSYESKHPLILHGNHKLTCMIISTEHLRLLHAGPTLLGSSLNRRYHIIGGYKEIRSATRKCVTCRRYAAKGQLTATRKNNSWLRF